MALVIEDGGRTLVPVSSIAWLDLISEETLCEIHCGSPERLSRRVRLGKSCGRE
jgi:hypothetical protein